MNKLSLSELKLLKEKGGQSFLILEAIKGGVVSSCHAVSDGRDVLIRVPGTHH